MKNVEIRPPQLFLSFFRWFCHPQLQGYIEGDLFEVYARRLEKYGKRRADMRFILDVLLLFRPGIIKAFRNRNLTTSAMYKNYLTIGWRTLLRNKGYAAINVGGLTLSITCAIIIFSFVTYHLSFDNFHGETDRTYRFVAEMHRDVVDYSDAVPSPLGEHVRNDHTFWEKVARIYIDRETLITFPRNGELVKFREDEGVAFTEASFFEMFNFPLQSGTYSSLKEPNTALITERLARKYFGDKDPVGETLTLEAVQLFTITGVLRDLPANTDFKSEIFLSWPTLKTYDSWLSDDIRGWSGTRGGMYCFIRLKPGVSVADVESVMPAYVKKFRPNSKNVHHYKLQPLADMHFDARYGGPVEKKKLWALSLIGLFLVVTACVNFVNLATAQALKRSKEVGVRKVLGSVKAQLFWQFIFETGIITGIGLAASGILSWSLMPSVSSFFDTQIPYDVFSLRGLAFVLALGVMITLMAGFYPGLVLAGFQPVVALKGKLSQTSIGGFNIRRTLIVAQFALSQVLIIGMIVVMNQMRYARYSDLGFKKEGILMVDMGSDSTNTKFRSLKGELANISSVEEVSTCFTAPASDSDWGNIIRFDNDTEDTNFRTSIKAIDAEYLSVFDLELAAGRNVFPSDTVREVLVNEALVRKLNLPSAEDAIGKMISANGGRMKGPIVGVVRDFHDKSFHEEISAILFVTSVDNYGSFAVKIDMRNAKSALAEIEKAWLATYPDQLFQYKFLDDSIAEFYETEDSMLKLIQFFSLVAIFIGSLGLYGLVSFMVAQKTKEIGVRKVLGASLAHIAGRFGREFVFLIAVAFLIAAPVGGWLMYQWLQEFQFQVPIDGWTFAPALACSLLIAAITVSYQVAKATLANPVNSLRVE